ncbi:nucleotide sugar dehydrogenase [Cellulosilyticum ruminicola]|uniref:nucleotide sugar dehydrogenase n=1 Tax=Cellulosilyticum ruminicola TaxID=425254 RepID=UPI0006CFBD06|nr:nucleotide sugar dehydrogenase [Cellulosilyticum ruminicola]
MRVVVVGAGYVGMANAVLLAQHNEVVISDISEERINLINEKKSPIKDKELEEYLKRDDLNLTGVTSQEVDYTDANYIIIATPTNYDEDKQYFDTSSIESVVENILESGSKAIIVIKSTIPVGYTEKLSKMFNCTNILFSPEFLREGRALYDNLYPSRIIVGWNKENSDMEEKAYEFAKLIEQATLKEETKIIIMNTEEAEGVKLFANTYLALRISFFNELDTYAEMRGLCSEKMIEGVCDDPRIGQYYNNPSFGYGGYCLPKDTKQLAIQFSDIPSKIIKSISESNGLRKGYIVDQIFKMNPKIIGIYRLSMKKSSDNYRQSSMIDIVEQLNDRGKEVIIYEPMLNTDEFMGNKVYKDLAEFKKESTIIVANRCEEEILDSIEKVYTRDLYTRD